MAKIYTSVFAGFVAFGCIIFILWILTTYKLLSMKQSAYVHKFMYNFDRVVALVFYSSCLGCGICDTLHMYLCWKNGYFPLGPKLSNIIAAADLFFFASSCSLNIILFGRVYFTFRSCFPLSKCVIFLVTFQIISSAFLDLTYCSLVVLFGSDESLVDHYSRPLILAIQINDVTVSISMIYLFCYKLKQLMTANNINVVEADPAKFKIQTVTLSPKIDIRNLQIKMDRKQCDVASLNSNQLKSIAVVTRHTVVSGFAIFFNQFFYLIAYVSMRTSFEESTNFGSLAYGLRMIGVTGVMISVYFGFTFGTKLYYKCCSCCHVTCYKCCSPSTRCIQVDNVSKIMQHQTDKRTNLLNKNESDTMQQNSSQTENTRSVSVIGKNVYNTNRKNKLINQELAIGENTYASTKSNGDFPIKNKIGEPSYVTCNNTQTSSIKGHIFVTNK